MIEKLVEAAAIAAIDALEVDGLVVNGFWQPSPAGTVKDAEDPASGMFLAVKAGHRRYQTFTTPVCEIPVSLSFAILAERFPNGAALAELIEPVMDLLDTWQRSIADVKQAFTVTGFTPSGFRLDGGEPVYDKGRTVWSVPVSFTLRGIASS